ncbi:MAG: alpha/beta hydrolase [Oligoflexus sp.]
MKNIQVFLICIVLSACKTTFDGQSKLASEVIKGPLPAEVYRQWQEHIRAETEGKQIQPDCQPTYFPASDEVPFQGIVVFFHGFTACPQQYFSIGSQLADHGFEVFLPLMPGQGREPRDGPGGNDDNYYDLPGGKDKDRYQNFVDRMNAMARAATGTKVIAGLSGGGSLATGAAIHGKDIWDRILVYAPYYKNPGMSGVASAALDVLWPSFKNDWGPECRENRRQLGGRAGLCALSIDAVRAMTDYGIYASSRAGEIEIPMQIAGVEHDPTADNGEINRVFQKLKNANLCFYVKGVPHSIINPKSDAPKLDPFWVPAMEEDSIAFITKGEWFKTDGSSIEYSQPRCRASL